ncbi:hypothetical protein TNCV_2790431 [Trichonephila clavipes]|nr:hypothetical protein TNCV_2790431 [Trichonephila clavipes]
MIIIPGLHFSRYLVILQNKHSSWKKGRDCSSAGIFSLIRQKLFASVHDHSAGTALQQVFSGHVIQTLIMEEMPGLLISRHFQLIRQNYLQVFMTIVPGLHFSGYLVVMQYKHSSWKKCRDCSSAGIFSLIRQKLFASVHDHSAGTAAGIFQYKHSSWKKCRDCRHFQPNKAKLFSVHGATAIQTNTHHGRNAGTAPQQAFSA